MKAIPLTQGREALVDDCDFEYLMQWTWWFASMPRYTGYARRKRINGDSGVYMHCLIGSRAGLSFEGQQIDHVDGNGLNNCRSNLRVATHAQNQQHRPRLNCNNTSGFKGVGWKKHAGKWEAHIGVNGRKQHLGYFDDPRDAALAYNSAALEYYGEFACLNSIGLMTKHVMTAASPSGLELK